jgi:hypothetical protein
MVESGVSEEQKAVEAIIHNNVKSKSLPAEAYEYMAQLIVEDSPQNHSELISLLGDFLSDANEYNEERSAHICEHILKSLVEKGMVKDDHRDAIIAERLHTPIVLNDIEKDQVI